MVHDPAPSPCHHVRALSVPVVATHEDMSPIFWMPEKKRSATDGAIEYRATRIFKELERVSTCAYGQAPIPAVPPVLNLEAPLLDDQHIPAALLEKIKTQGQNGHSQSAISQVVHNFRQLFRPAIGKEPPEDGHQEGGLVGFFKSIFVSKQCPTCPEVELFVAKALSVSVQDLERAISPLRALRLITNDWPEVHVGHVESRYGECKKIVGRGTGGVVKVFSRPDGSLFAIKEFRQRRRRESPKQYASNLVREYCIGSVLHHPNVIQTVDLMIDSDRLYEVMEYCSNDLFQYIQKARYGTNEINCFFKQIVLGVAYLHSLGIAHRDLKPENICMDSHARLKIIDFGLCSIFKTQRSSSTKKCKGLCGSTPYIAPEEWLSEEYDPQQVDVWSCGIIFLTLTFHAFPWEHASLNDANFTAYLDSLRARQVYPLFTRIPVLACRELIQKMLHPKPSKRISMQQILKDPWFQAIEVCNECHTSSSPHNHSIPE